MRTKLRTRVTFSDDAVSVDLPASWQQLSQQELESVLSLCAMHSTDATARNVEVFLRLSSGRHVRTEDGRMLMAFSDGTAARTVWVTAESMAVYMDMLSWLDEPGPVPVRLDCLDVPGKPEAVDAELHGVTFADWIRVENLYQGYLASKDRSALLSMAGILYPGLGEGTDISPAEELGVMLWAVQLKMMFSEIFPHFFRRTEGQSDLPDMAEVMNCEIRALTGGDVTKEETVLNTDCWRALTELDFKAKEAEDMRRRMKK